MITVVGDDPARITINIHINTPRAEGASPTVGEPFKFNVSSVDEALAKTRVKESNSKVADALRRRQEADSALGSARSVAEASQAALASAYTEQRPNRGTNEAIASALRETDRVIRENLIGGDSTGESDAKDSSLLEVLTELRDAALQSVQEWAREGAALDPRLLDKVVELTERIASQDSPHSRAECWASVEREHDMRKRAAADPIKKAGPIVPDVYARAAELALRRSFPERIARNLGVTLGELVDAFTTAVMEPDR